MSNKYLVKSTNEARGEVTVDRETVVRSLIILSGQLMANIHLKELDRRNTLTVTAGKEHVTYSLITHEFPTNPFASFV